MKTEEVSDFLSPEQMYEAYIEWKGLSEVKQDALMYPLYLTGARRPRAGAAYAGALEYLKRTDLNLKTRQKAVFIACDRVEWYVSYFKARRPELFGLKALPKETTISEEELEKVESIDPKKIKKWAGTQPSVILDVRSNSAFNSEHIPGSINIPSSDLKDMISTTLPFSKDTPILVVCSMGETSRKMAALLTQKGFKTINLAGGIRAWMSHNQKE